MILGQNGDVRDHELAFATEGHAFRFFGVRQADRDYEKQVTAKLLEEQSVVDKEAAKLLGFDPKLLQVLNHDQPLLPFLLAQDSIGFGEDAIDDGDEIRQIRKRIFSNLLRSLARDFESGFQPCKKL
jgi:hypothetical protein